MKLGIDLDHTIINYNHAFLNTAKTLCLVPDTFDGNKNFLKRYILTQHGEKDWMRLQGHVYGKRIHEAQPMPYVIEFLQRCNQLSIPFVIISHKTQFGHFDEEKTDLRQSARDWLAKQHFFDEHIIRSPKHQLFFATTREEKLRMITKQSCTLFIDDLLDLLLDPKFPNNVKRVWYAYGEEQTNQVPNTMSILNNWQQATRIFEVNHVDSE
ncbi:MAG: hypothetical protein ACD_46C00210G0004 [uncultured bacterium]|nr:MAG: hypothetical protein ACD_46C00210G0004 [uncultured bacterium]OGT47542.1 MAG: hypothetical protein A3E83_06560 [Gammaproteobacteria bacterium RIFCSPHIGHO2_12_FULL_41_20]HLB43581.1 hypothetical protein [Gammaproteobacteria bacterium]